MIKTHQLHSQATRKKNKLKERAQNGITRVKPHLNRIVLSTGNSYADLQEKLLGLGIDRDFRRKRGMVPYRKRACVEWKGMSITVYYTRYSYRSALARIEITSTSIKSLLKLVKGLPGANVYSVEYAIDILCENPERVADLFRILLRYMYFPNQRGEMEFFGGHFFGGRRDYDREENAGVRLGNVTVYERGSDETRKIKTDGFSHTNFYWDHWDVDRVRVKFVFDRKRAGWDGLAEFPDLIRELSFRRKIGQLLRFKVFKGEDEFPGAGGVFQKVYAKFRKSGTAPHRHIKNAKGLKKLRTKIKRAIREFDAICITKRKEFLKKNSDMSRYLASKVVPMEGKVNEWTSVDMYATKKLERWKKLKKYEKKYGDRFL